MLGHKPAVSWLASFKRADTSESSCPRAKRNSAPSSSARPASSNETRAKALCCAAASTSSFKSKMRSQSTSKSKEGSTARSRMSPATSVKSTKLDRRLPMSSAAAPSIHRLSILLRRMESCQSRRHVAVPESAQASSRRAKAAPTGTQTFTGYAMRTALSRRPSRTFLSKPGSSASTPHVSKLSNTSFAESPLRTRSEISLGTASPRSHALSCIRRRRTCSNCFFAEVSPAQRCRKHCARARSAAVSAGSASGRGVRARLTTPSL
mmetsp:Transcript_48325/g.127943  ORF Transcript_48325/g.127943 Transcript_48325/m.127943 type:complete len:265 (-) Transcript_48325:420-1214(-)